MVAVSVNQVEDVRRCRNQDSFLPGHHPRWEVKSVCKNEAGLEAAIPVAVFEQADSSLRFPVVRIVDHLDRVDPSLRIERNCDRVGHIGLGCYQLNTESFWKAE